MYVCIPSISLHQKGSLLQPQFIFTVSSTSVYMYMYTPGCVIMLIQRTKLYDFSFITFESTHACIHTCTYTYIHADIYTYARHQSEPASASAGVSTTIS